ncbi:MAG: head GIN domain-containing protein, partial [Bacteroidota bacterium]
RKSFVFLENLKKTDMKQLFFYISFITFFNCQLVFAQDYIKGNGNVVKKNRSISEFDVIEAKGMVNVFLEQGNSNSILVEADENLHDHIITKVSGKTLTIKNDINIRDAVKVDIYVTFNEIEALDGSGATDIEALTSLKTSDDFYLKASGAVDMNIKKGLQCKTLSIEASGSSDIYLDNASPTSIKANVSGSTDLEMSGNAEDFTLTAGGSSDVEAKDFSVKNATISATGSSDIYTHVTDKIMVSASGSSDVYYTGNPSVEQINASRAADVLKQ